MEQLTQIAFTLIGGFEYLFFIYVGCSCLYVFVFAVAGHFYTPKRVKRINSLSNMAVMIPAYKEDAVIVEVAKSALAQNYPKDNYDVVVIADSLNKSTLFELAQLPIQLIEVSFDKSTKSKALNRAMDSITKHFDHALILDADNLMEPDFLLKLNAAFTNGFQIVQGHRMAKNRNTSFAILDAASEEINNFIYRQGHRALGLSSGLIGSGMAFEYQLFKSMMATVTAVGGFDKELEFKFAKRKIKIEYLQDAKVYDEKIQRASDFSKQRRRWISTQLIYLKANFKAAWYELLVNRNITFFDKVFQMFVPPRVLLFGVTLLTTMAYLLIQMSNGVTNQMTSLWILNLGLVTAAFLLALPKSFYNLKTVQALFSLPVAFGRMFLLLFKMKGANKIFIHTAHGSLKN